jgi:hypothetical protein
MKLSDPSYIEPQHVLVFGDPKTGKSTLVSQLAEVGWKLIWISSDNGHSILRKLSKEAQDRIELVRLPDTRDYPVAVDAFRELFKYKPINFCDTHGKSNCTVCAGNGTSFTSVNLSSIPPDTIVVWDNLSQLSDSYLSLITKGKPVDYKLQLDDWGSLAFHLKKGLMDIQVAPFNFIGIAHAVEEAMTDGNKKIMPAIGSSQFAPKVAGYFDHIAYVHTMNNKHKAGSASTYINNVVTGSRTDVALEKMPVASLDAFFNKVPEGWVPPVVTMLKEVQKIASPAVQETPVVVATSAVQSVATDSGAAARAKELLAKMRKS